MKTMNVVLMGASVLLACVTSGARAGVLHVPGDASTIQKAINLASSGDTIIVAPGIYMENISFLGKRLVIQSSGGKDATILDGAGEATVVMAISGEPAGTALRGFTVIRGAGNVTSAPMPGSEMLSMELIGGGGVAVTGGSQLELRDCDIVGNRVETPDPSLGLPYPAGGGVLVDGGTVTLFDCLISDNMAAMGSALSLGCSGGYVLMDGCTITGNVSEPESAAVVGGVGVMSATDTLVAGNFGSGWAAGNAFTRLRRVTFVDNAAWGFEATCFYMPSVVGCTFLGNGAGGARLQIGDAAGGTSLAQGCVFANGDHLELGPAEDSVHTIDGCTFDGGHVVAHSGDVIITNSIARHLTEDLVQGAFASLEIRYSNIEDGAAGPGNIDADPLWVDAAAGDYHLQALSPCIDAGDPASPSEPDGSAADMGAFAYAMWDDMGSLKSPTAAHSLEGQGVPIFGRSIALRLTGLPSQHFALVVGLSPIATPIKGELLWPAPHLVVADLLADPSGQVHISTAWPVAILSGVTVYLQAWDPSDAVNPCTNGLRVSTF